MEHGTARDEAAELQERLHHVQWLLYVSHALNQFSDVAWQFCLVIFLAMIDKDASLFLVSTYGICVGLATTLFLPRMGSFIDVCSSKGMRLQLAQTWILAENLAVLSATACCWFALHAKHATAGTYQDNDEDADDSVASGASIHHVSWRHLSLVGMHFFGAAAKVLDQSFLVAVEKDWIVAISHEYLSFGRKRTACPHPPTQQTDGDHDDSFSEEDVLEGASDIGSMLASTWLGTTNVQLKQIDLTCKIMAPAVSGWLLGRYESAVEHNATAAGTDGNGDGSDENSYANSSNVILVGILWIAGLSILALLIELVCVSWVHSKIPSLSEVVEADSTECQQNNPADRSYMSCRSMSRCGGRTAVVDGANDRCAEGASELSQAPDSIDAQSWSPSSSSSSARSMSSFDRIDQRSQHQHQHQNHRTLSNAAASSAISRSTVVRAVKSLISYVQDLVDVYFAQGPVAYGGIGLALLYLNMINFSGLMTAYLVSDGTMSLKSIGVWRGVSSAMGLLGTFAFQWSTQGCPGKKPADDAVSDDDGRVRFDHSRIPSTARLEDSTGCARPLGLEWTGAWSIVWEFACLSVSASSLLFPTTNSMSIMLLISGVLPSRVGLWVYDITIVQMMQQTVAAPVRGRVGGIQSSMEAMMGFCPFLLGLVYTQSSQFSVFIVLSWMAVGAAMLLYIWGIALPHYIRSKRDQEMMSLVSNETHRCIGSASKTK